MLPYMQVFIIKTKQYTLLVEKLPEINIYIKYILKTEFQMTGQKSIGIFTRKTMEYTYILRWDSGITKGLDFPILSIKSELIKHTDFDEIIDKLVAVNKISVLVLMFAILLIM